RREHDAPPGTVRSSPQKPRRHRGPRGGRLARRREPSSSLASARDRRPMPTAATRIPEILSAYQADILDQWSRLQLAAVTRRSDLISEEDLRAQSRDFLAALTRALQHGRVTEVESSPAWAEIRQRLESLSARRARAGFSPSETATFVFSLKEPLFVRLRQELERDPRALADETWAITVLLDKLGLMTIESF